MKGLAIIESSPSYIVSSQWPDNIDHKTFPEFSIYVTDCNHSWTTTGISFRLFLIIIAFLVDPSYLEMIKPSGIDESQFSQLTFSAFCPGAVEQSSLGTPFLSATLSEDKSDLTVH